MSGGFLAAGWGFTDADEVVDESGWLSEEVVPVMLADIERELASAQLPLHENERVEFWTRRFVTEEKKAFEETLSRAGLYSDMITAKLRERGMPEELMYLAMIESGFFPDAQSYVAALGAWQFMSPTAWRTGSGSTRTSTSDATPFGPPMRLSTTWAHCTSGTAPGIWLQRPTTRDPPECPARSTDMPAVG